MENEKNQWIFMSLNVTFTMFAFNISFFLQRLMQAQYNLSYIKVFSLLYLIIISFGLSAIPVSLIKFPQTNKRKYGWAKIKRNQIILMSISFIMNILVMFVFIYKAIVQLQLPYSTTLLLDSMFFMFAYGLGIAEIYVIDFICKKVDKKADKYGDDKEKEKRFRGIVKGVIILSCAVITFLPLWFINL